MSTQAGCNATTLATQESAWLMLAGHFIRSTFSTITLIQFLPQTLLNLLVIVSTLTTIYQSRVSCKPVFVFILNQAVADFGLAIVFVVVVNLRHEAGGDLHNIERFVMSGHSAGLSVLRNLD